MAFCLLTLRRNFRKFLWTGSKGKRFMSAVATEMELDSINPRSSGRNPYPRRSLKSSIWIKLTVFIGTLVVLSSGVLAAVLWLKTREQLSKEIERRLVAVSILRRGEVDDYFIGEIDKMVLISSRIQIINYLANRSEVSKATAEYDLRSAISAISEFKSAAIFDSSGKLRIATEDTFEEKLQFKNPEMKSPVHIELPILEGNTWSYNISKGIYMNDTRIGMLIARINATTLADLIYERIGLQKSGELLVGVPMNNKTFHLVMPPRMNPQVTSLPWKTALDAAMQKRSGVLHQRDYRGVKVICAYTPMGYSNWVLLAKVDTREAYAPVDNIKIVISIMIVITLILGIIASLCVAKIFTSPIIELGRVAAALGEGDMGARVNIGCVWFRDEIHELQVIFNSMADQISNHHATLEQKVFERTRALARANDELASEIDERKRIEVELQMAKDAAVAADKAKSEFLANMSHEIRTPLNGIINCTELCLDTRTSLEQQEYLDLVRFSAKHLLRIITDILDFSKIEAGKLEMEEIQFSLYDQLEHAVSVLAARAHKKGLEIAWRAGLDVPDQLIGDPGRLFQIFVNLIGNSIKFTEKGEVVVSAQVHNIYRDRVELIFAVKDTGVGIPKAKQSLLFQAFSQVDSSTTRLYGGTGLGLVISSKLAAAMAGKMWVESEGKGSIFYFTAAFDIPPSCDLPLSPKIDGLKGIKALVVDDHITSLGILVSMLKAWGMIVETSLTVEDAKHALQLASHSKPFQVLLVDLWQPGSKAAELVHYVQERPGLIGKSRIKEIKRLLSSGGSVGNCSSTIQMLVEEVDPEFPAGTHHTDRRAFEKSGSSELPRLVDSTEVPSIIMLTSIDHTDGERCRNLGVELYTSKPIKRALLIRTLQAAIGIHKNDALRIEHSQQAKLEASPEEHKSLKILVAEDNIVNQRVAVSLLRKWGHSAVIACNGAEAIEKASQETFDLILMDVQMPICDGFQATTKIREMEKNKGMSSTPIVAMTAHAMFGDGDRCIAAGMDGYISKPLNAKKLQELLVTSSKLL
ncbi:uncharacterized protein LOC9658361 [Selaginella moellendorffii]|uniref:uncharacterized protein LOC9658361 n=1 Tax=Selaginella moellendorffii TaxID=88036 RepID=UPI000D1CC781|nr:uncharacterized protein LOC9658361 [Selaginella moellendorffii]|eukprot:XP_024535096.1 uncharacterized protein LOC9658361 [Selaginella moellendorffii]